MGLKWTTLKWKKIMSKYYKVVRIMMYTEELKVKADSEDEARKNAMYEDFDRVHDDRIYDEYVIEADYENQ